MHRTFLAIALFASGCASRTVSPAAADATSDGSDAEDGAVSDAAPTKWLSGRIFGPGYSIREITSDDWIVLADGTPNWKALSLHTGEVRPLPRMQTKVDGPSLFLWEGTSGPLRLWRADTGLTTLSENALMSGGGFAAHSLGMRVAFIDGPVAGALTLSDAKGGSRVSLGPAYDGCNSRLRFTADRFVAAYCTGKGGARLAVFDLAGKVIQEKSVIGVDVNDRGDVLMYAPNGPAWLLPSTATSLTDVTATMRSGLLSADGAVTYSDPSLDLYRFVGGISTKIAANAHQFLSSHDGKHVVYGASDTMPADRTLGSTAAPGAGTLVASDVLYEYFTRDDSHYVYLRETKALEARPVTDAPTRAIATNVRLFLPTVGARVLVSRESGELLYVNLAVADAPKTIGTGIDAWGPTHDGSHVVYIGPSGDVFLAPLD